MMRRRRDSTGGFSSGIPTIRTRRALGMPWDSACSAPVACHEASRVFGELWLLSPSSPLAADAARQLRVIGEGGLGGPAPTPKERIERAERLLGAGAGDSARSEAEALLDAKLPADLAARALKIVADAARRAGRVDAATATVNRALGELPADRRAPWLLDLARLQQRKSSDLALATLDKLVREYPKSPEAAEATRPQGPDPRERGARSGCRGRLPEARRRLSGSGRGRAAPCGGWAGCPGSAAPMPRRRLGGAGWRPCAADRRTARPRRTGSGALTSSAATAMRPRVSSRRCRPMGRGATTASSLPPRGGAAPRRRESP